MSAHPMGIEQFTMWLANGERGLSSSAIVIQLTGVQVHSGFGGGHPRDNWFHPLDAWDWRRCELLLRAVPEAREHLCVMRTHPVWAALVDNWEELVELAPAGFFEDSRVDCGVLSRRLAELLHPEVES